MSDKYYLGIDGGGTKTSFIIINQYNKIIYNKKSTSSAVDTVSLDEIKKVFIEGTKDFNHKVDSVFAGIGGITNDNERKMIIDIIKDLKICDKNTKIDANNDVYNAIYGGLGGKDGIIIIAGTGSVCFGKHNNITARSGGYSYKEGDGGSGYYLGHRALQHLARVIDGRKRKTFFSKKLMEEINCNDYASLATYFNNATRTQIASLAKIVTDCSNDIYAKQIIKNAVNEIYFMIKAVYKKLKFNEDIIYFTIIGSLGNANTLYKDLLLEKIMKISSKIKYIDNCFMPDYGSALRAKEV